MNYKLVQKLKKAGFPFDFKESKMGDDTYTYPSLEELIEVCEKEIVGPNLNTREKKPVEHLLRFGWTGDKWFADYEFYESHLANEYNNPLIEFGETLEEAVANLYIKINENNPSKFGDRRGSA